MTTQYEQGRDAIATVLTGITNIGAVHAYPRYAREVPALKTLYLATIGGVVQIRAWEILSPSDDWEPMSSRGIHEHYIDYMIRGFQSLDDSTATYKTFRTMAETVCITLRGNTSLSGICLEVLPPRIRAFREVMFTGVLCHMVEISVRVLFSKAITLV